MDARVNIIKQLAVARADSLQKRVYYQSCPHTSGQGSKMAEAEEQRRNGCEDKGIIRF
jgi:hypothetical protein